VNARKTKIVEGDGRKKGKGSKKKTTTTTGKTDCVGNLAKFSEERKTLVVQGKPSAEKNHGGWLREYPGST